MKLIADLVPLFITTFVMSVVLPTETAASLRNLATHQINRSFTIHPTTHTFLKDGAPFQFISGSMHYFRIPKIYWLDRLEKAKAAGLDAIELYIPWNFHEWEEGAFNFAEDRDLEFFLRLVADLGMLAIVRVGPYVCAEWSFGGLPPWILKKNPRMLIRSSDSEYFSLVTKWFGVLLPILRPSLYSSGGPIIMIQLENEYGSSTICDKHYMSMLYDLARFHLGPDVILFTVDGNSVDQLRCGSPDNRYLATIDFGPSFNDSPSTSFDSIERFRTGQPLVNSEFYTGWFDHWGDMHSKTETDLLVNSLQSLLKYSNRVNVNMYMFHGGTNFGFWNGDSGTGPVVTSYDYDAPITESGDLTEKYMALRKMIYEFKQKKPSPLPKNTTKTAYGTVGMHLSGHLMANTFFHEETPFPVNMEAFDQYGGFFVYGTKLPGSTNNTIALIFERFADVAQIYTSDEKLFDLQWHGQLHGPYAEMQLNLTAKSNHTRLLLLLENTGYVNFGDRMWNDVKGLIQNVTHAGVPLGPWANLYVQDVPGLLKPLPKEALWPVQGSIFSGTLVLNASSELRDTFIQPESFGRGVVYINGRNLGRFDQTRGPQRRLFVPRSMLRHGANPVLVIELHAVNPSDLRVTFYADHLLST